LQINELLDMLDGTMLKHVNAHPRECGALKDVNLPKIKNTKKKPNPDQISQSMIHGDWLEDNTQFGPPMYFDDDSGLVDAADPDEESLNEAKEGEELGHRDEIEIGQELEAMEDNGNERNSDRQGGDEEDDMYYEEGEMSMFMDPPEKSRDGSHVNEHCCEVSDLEIDPDLLRLSVQLH